MRTLALAVFAISLAAAATLRAQCSQLWVNSGGFPGTDGGVGRIATWDPDGPGPLPARLVVGGAFAYAGSQLVNRVATLDVATGAWSPLHLGIHGNALGFATLSNGDLAVAGGFPGAVGTNSPGILRWNGASWASVGGGVGAPYVCSAVLPRPNGGLIVAGTFRSAGGVPASSIAQWDGNAWSALGSGLAGPDATGSALVEMPNGDVVVGGNFTSAGGVPAQFVAKWDGNTWSAMPGLSEHARLLALAPTGDLIAMTIGGSLQRWTGAGWTSFVTLAGPLARATSLDVLANGDLAIGGLFTAVGGVPATNLARWDGSLWHALGNGDNPPHPSSVHMAPNGDLFVGGSFHSIGQVWARGIARWSGGDWHALGTGIGTRVVAQAVLPDQRLVVATSDRLVLRGDASGWRILGGELPNSINALEVLDNGDLVVAGAFDFPGGTRVLRWDGSSWVPFATPLANAFPGGAPVVAALHAMPDGSLLVGGRFTHAGGVAVWNVARWTGSAWQAWQQGVRSADFGGGNVARVTAFAPLPDGAIAVGGEFTTASGLPARNVARWNGSSWSSFGSGLPPSGLGFVNALAVAGNGELIAGGTFAGISPSMPSFVARWNGATWVGLGSGVDGGVWALLTLPGGDVIASGGFTVAGGVPAARIARWNGTNWSSVGGGLAGTPVGWLPARVHSLRFLADGRLSVAGPFETAGGVFSPFLASLVSACPASTAAYGAGCAGTGGTLALSPRDLPWLGGSMRNVASGFLPTSLLARVLGFAPSFVPLASLHPVGGAGCDLLVDALTLDFMLPLHGSTVTTSLPIPAAAAWIGTIVREQALEIEVDGLGAFTRINASNALFATVGAF